MRKALIAAVAFIASVILGCIVLLLITMAVGYAGIALYQPNHTGVGSIAGGISETAVFATPILGCIGTLTTFRRIERKSPSTSPLP